jgi:hypothetical protein
MPAANAALMYDKMVNELLSEAFSVQDELDLIGELVSEKLPIGDETTIRGDVTQYCTQVMIIAKRLDHWQSPTPEAQENSVDHSAEPVGVEAGRVNGTVHGKSNYGQGIHAGPMVQGACSARYPGDVSGECFQRMAQSLRTLITGSWQLLTRSGFKLSLPEPRR